MAQLSLPRSLHKLGDMVSVLKAQDTLLQPHLLDVASLDFPNRFGNKSRGTHFALLGCFCGEVPLPNLIVVGASGS